MLATLAKGRELGTIVENEKKYFRHRGQEKALQPGPKALIITESSSVSQASDPCFQSAL